MASLSKHLQAPDILTDIVPLGYEALRSELLARGAAWYNENPAETELIRENLLALSLPADEKGIENIRNNIILHYYEKLLPLCGSPAWYHEYLATRVDFNDAAALISSAAEAGGVLIAVAHFGAVELISPMVATLKTPVNAVLRFTTEKFSAMAKAQAAAMEATGSFGKISFIEIGREGTMAAMDMAAALRRKEILFSVFDEETGYSIPAPLFGKMVKGGAGLQNLIRFVRAPLTVFCAFMIRTGDDRYRLQLVPITDMEKPVEAMYAALQGVLSEHLEQWYFLHEEIPFVE